MGDDYEIEIDDNTGLIPDNPLAQIPTSQFTIIRFCTLKLFSQICLIFLHEIYCGGIIGIFLGMLVILTDFWFSKNADGLELIGMRWFSYIDDNNELKMLYYARSDPYVPEALNFTIFWAFIYLANIGWLIQSIAMLFYDDITFFLVSLIGFSLSFINTYGFIKCRQEWSKKGDDVARALLLGDAFTSEDNIE